MALFGVELIGKMQGATVQGEELKTLLHGQTEPTPSL